MAEIKTKACRTCDYAGDNFSPGKGRCRPCCANAARMAYRRNPELFRARSSAWARMNPEKITERARGWNRSGAQRRANVRYYARHRDDQRHRASIGYANARGAEGSYTLADWEKLLSRHAGACAYCGSPAETRDHVVPVSRGGSNYIGNILPACKFCNTSKSNRLLSEWKRETFSRPSGKANLQDNVASRTPSLG